MSRNILGSGFEFLSDVDRVKDEVIGTASQYVGQNIMNKTHIELSKRPDVQKAIQEDNLQLPSLSRREGYFVDRDLEYWLCGLRDAEYVTAEYPKLNDGVVVEIGGASGRVIRHLPRLLGPSNKYFITDINEEHVVWTNEHLAPSVVAALTKPWPPMPFPDKSVDILFAFSVFTHIYEYETAWLLEAKRILKPGGLLYVTVHDDVTWETIEQSVLHPLMTREPLVQAARAKMPKLKGRWAGSYAIRDDVRVSNVFHPADYIRKVWGALFQIKGIHPRRHDHQAGVVMQA